MCVSVGGTGSAGLQIINMPLLPSVPEKEQQLQLTLVNMTNMWLISPHTRSSVRPHMFIISRRISVSEVEYWAIM